MFFDNGKSEEIDMIIECTGYRKGYDYFADESLQTPDYNKLYRGFIRTDDPSLYFLGLVRPMIGSVPAFVEYQSQYVVDLFKQSIQLPSSGRDAGANRKDMEYHRTCSRAVGASVPISWMVLPIILTSCPQIWGDCRKTIWMVCQKRKRKRC